MVGACVLLMQLLGLNYALRFGFVFGSQSDVCTVMYKSAWWLILAMICVGLLVFMVDAKLIALTSHVHSEKEEDLTMLGDAVIVLWMFHAMGSQCASSLCT